MNNLSKSRYTRYCQCAKSLWLQVHKPEEAVVDAATQARFESGNEVGDLAMSLFGDYVEVTTKHEDGSLDLSAMIEKTRACIENGTNIICEASFSIDGNYCAVDVLRKTDEGYAIYEVKSSSFPELDGKEVKLEKYAPDIAYQKWVLTQCGIKVTGTYLVCLNSDYRLNGDLDVQKLFVIIDMADLVANELAGLPERVVDAMRILQQSEEPAIEISASCNKPYPCAFWAYCTKHIPNPSVFNLYRMKLADKLELYRQGFVTYEDVRSHDLKPIHRTQVECTLQQKQYIDVDGIHGFLDTLSYPLFFLDFETMQPAIPLYQGTKPYQQIPFQYSLHIIDKEGGELQHCEHLGISGTDTRRLLAEHLCDDIPKDVCTLAYNKKFECGRIKEMAEAFPDLADHLMNIHDNILDLLDPFQAGYYYLPAMGGSFSIKSVLPALFPDDPELNYHNLDCRVQNGGDAMTIFPRIKDMPIDEQLETRKALLAYCCLDTLAMVKLWEKLKDAVK